MQITTEHIQFPGITIEQDPRALFVRSEQPLHTISSGLCGGGIQRLKSIVNMHVIKGYDNPDPIADLENFVRRSGVDGPYIGMMTAAYIYEAELSVQTAGDLRVCAITTAGLSNAICAGVSPPVVLRPGTINTILLVDAALSESAMVNAVITATEAKTGLLHALDQRTAEGDPATGTSTDAIVVACTGRGETLPYSCAVTPVGYLIARAVRESLEAVLVAQEGHR